MRTQKQVTPGRRKLSRAKKKHRRRTISALPSALSSTGSPRLPGDHHGERQCNGFAVLESLPQFRFVKTYKGRCVMGSCRTEERESAWFHGSLCCTIDAMSYNIVIVECMHACLGEVTDFVI